MPLRKFQYDIMVEHYYTKNFDIQNFIVLLSGLELRLSFEGREGERGSLILGHV